MRRSGESSMASPTALLLNVGHALDHLFLLIFATAVAAILDGALGVSDAIENLLTRPLRAEG